MLLVLAVFAALSFRDAFRYARSGNASDVTVKLPRPIMLLSHKIMRGSLRAHHLILGSFAAGAAVTALESVCTGQVYVPTLVLVLRSGHSSWEAVAYLLLYNALFMLPLVVAFVLTHQGLSMQRLLGWSRRNVVISKVLMGLFFVALAVLTMIL
jgi:cytochrome c biogenesis protein CcdA